MPDAEKVAEEIITEYRKAIQDFDRLDEQGNDERFGLLEHIIAKAIRKRNKE